MFRGARVRWVVGRVQFQVQAVQAVGFGGLSRVVSLGLAGRGVRFTEAACVLPGRHSRAHLGASWFSGVEV